MSRAKKQRLDPAAYTASQPLFEALRNARDKSLPDQAVNLTVAHDIVKHVGGKYDDQHGNIERHVTYMDAIVESWRNATDAYCDIFAHLTTITAEKPNEGVGAAESHGLFKEILETAQKAQDAARKFTLAKERAEYQGATTSQSESAAPAAESDDEIELAHKPPSCTDQANTPSNVDSADAAPSEQPAKSDKVKWDKSGTRVLWIIGAKQPRVPFATLGSSEKKEWLAEKARQKREKQKGKVQEIRTKEEQQDRKQEQKPMPPVPVDDFENIKLSGVEYEDLSAEVEARIKAEKEAKKARKQERKRKRESKDSFVDHDAVQEDDKEDTIEVKQYEKPSKKKNKHAGVEGTPGLSSAPQTGNSTPAADCNTILVSKKEKRKQDEEETVKVSSKKQKKGRD